MFWSFWCRIALAPHIGSSRNQILAPSATARNQEKIRQRGIRRGGSEGVICLLIARSLIAELFLVDVWYRDYHMLVKRTEEVLDDEDRPESNYYIR